MERQVVESSNIRSIGYDVEAKMLEVEFNSGTYQIDNFPADEWHNFVNSSSKGSYYAKFIRGQYVARRIA